MAIVTITDGVFGFGQALSRRVSALLDYKFICEEDMIKAGHLRGLTDAAVENALGAELPWWKRMVRHDYRQYRVALESAMCDLISAGNIVYYGRAGQELVPSIRHVLKVLLLVPIAHRTEQAMKAKGLAKDAAARWLGEADDITDQRLRDIFGVGWRDSTRYDFAVGASRLNLESIACLIVKVLGKADYQPTGQSEAELQNRILEAKVRLALLRSKHTNRLDIQVQANSGLVHLSAFLDPISYDFKNEIIRIAEEVSGVRNVTTDIRVLPANDDDGPLWM